jgi:hypothetical protein
MITTESTEYTEINRSIFKAFSLFLFSVSFRASRGLKSII